MKAASLIKDAINHSSTGLLTEKSIADWQKLLGLIVPVLCFLRRYSSIFHQFPRPLWPSFPCFRLADTVIFLHSLEQSIHQNHESNTVEMLSKVLMMMKTKLAPLHSLQPLKWDLDLPDCFEKTIIPKYPKHFKFVKYPTSVTGLKLAQWNVGFTVSALQRINENKRSWNTSEYRDFKKGQAVLVFPMKFSRGYGAQKKVRAWMEECQKLPYISPYANCSKVDTNNDLMKKRVVGVLHT